MKLANYNALINEILAQILAAQNNNQLPSLEQVQHFTRLARNMPMHADEFWLAEAEDFAHLADQLLLAVKDKRFEEAVQLVDSIKEAWSFFPENN